MTSYEEFYHKCDCRKGVLIKLPNHIHKQRVREAIKKIKKNSLLLFEANSIERFGIIKGLDDLKEELRL